MPFDDDKTDVVFGVGKRKEIGFDGVEDFFGGLVLYFVQFLFEMVGGIQFFIALMFN